MPDPDIERICSRHWLEWHRQRSHSQTKGSFTPATRSGCPTMLVTERSITNDYFGRKATVWSQLLAARFFSHVTAVANILNQSVAQEQDACIRRCLFYITIAVQAPSARLLMWQRAGCACQCEHWSPWATPWLSVAWPLWLTCECTLSLGKHF